MKERLKKSFKTLWGYSKNKNQWEVGFDDPPYEQLLKVAGSYYKAIWSFDQFDHYLAYHWQTIKGKPIDDNTIETIIDDIFTRLSSNMRDVFIVVPLKGATINASVTIGNFSIIKTSQSDYFSRPLPFDDIVSETSKITGISKERIEKAFRTFERGRSEDFLLCPLLILKEHGQYDVIANVDYSHYLLRYYDIFLKTIASKNNIKRSHKSTEFLEANHFFCVDMASNYNHMPIRNTININFDLSFLHTASNQQILTNIVSLFESRFPNSLQATYFRSMRFYSYGLEGSEFSIEDVSLRLLNTLIAAETLLVFTTRGEKKSKLAKVMVELSSIPEPEKGKHFNAIIEAYNDRSWLVHSGKQDVSKYIMDLISERRESESLILLNRMIAQILTKFPDWYNEISDKTLPEEYLNLWKERIKLLLPSPKNYNLLQKFIVCLINVLKKIGKIEQE